MFEFDCFGAIFLFYCLLFNASIWLDTWKCARNSLVQIPVFLLSFCFDFGTMCISLHFGWSCAQTPPPTTSYLCLTFTPFSEHTCPSFDLSFGGYLNPVSYQLVLDCAWIFPVPCQSSVQLLFAWEVFFWWSTCWNSFENFWLDYSTLVSLYVNDAWIIWTNKRVLKRAARTNTALQPRCDVSVAQCATCNSTSLGMK